MESQQPLGVVVSGPDQAMSHKMEQRMNTASEKAEGTIQFMKARVNKAMGAAKDVLKRLNVGGGEMRKQYLFLQ